MSSTTCIHSCWFCLVSSVHVHSGPCSTSIVQYSQQHEPYAETAERITFRIATWWSSPSVLCLGRAPFSSSICSLNLINSTKLFVQISFRMKLNVRGMFKTRSQARHCHYDINRQNMNRTCTRTGSGTNLMPKY